MLGIGETLMRELIRTGRVPVLRLGRRVLVSRAALERLVG
jgi:excisionase family DNA binding protein